MDPPRSSMTPVLLPGNMCDARLWTEAVRGVLPGAIDADLTLDDSVIAMAERTLNSVPGPLLPVGFSMGAIVAVEMWHQAPDRIGGLVLLGYNATADLLERALHRPNQQAEVRQGGLERVLVEEMKPNYLGARHRSDAALLELLRDMGMGLGPEVFVRQSEALRLRPDRRDILARIGVPVLLGCGAEDALCPPAWHDDWAARIAEADRFTIEGAGHMLPLEAPETLADHISRWCAAKEIA
jgi:pimeloyl-ACP methyl ester carboxylesterase